MANLNQLRAATPRVIAWASLTDEPWRNGGGVTRQILSRRLAASGEWVPSAADDWDWRLSIASVDSAGAFSRFTGMTRVLTVIEGTSIILTVDGMVEELELFRPFRFDGGAETSAELPNGPIRDLNVIARCRTGNGGAVNADLRVEALHPHHPYPVVDGQYCVLLAGHALMSMRSDGAEKTAQTALGLYDTVIGSTTHSLAINGQGIIALITVESDQPA